MEKEKLGLKDWNEKYDWDDYVRLWLFDINRIQDEVNRLNFTTELFSKLKSMLMDMFEQK